MKNITSAPETQNLSARFPFGQNGVAHMREVRAIVTGLVVVVLVATAFAIWRRPAREFHRIRGYRVEVSKTEGDSTRHMSFHVPVSLVARVASFVPGAAFGGDIKTDWGEGEITAREILEAARQSAPGKPGVVEKHGNHIEVTADGAILDIQIKDSWDKVVKVRLPRSIVEGLSDRRTISVKDILRRLDELGPGDVVTVRDRDSVVTISAEPK